MTEQITTEQARQNVLEAAREGRATYLPAGARDNDTARVLIDGIEVGQASVLLAGDRVQIGQDVNSAWHGVGRYGTGSMFGVRHLVVRP